jgi:hypothetical protein
LFGEGHARGIPRRPGARHRARLVGIA